MTPPGPTRASAPPEFRRPPLTTVGARAPAASTLATRLVVVVLPCVPATAMPRFRRISSASMMARGTTGIREARAAITSGLSPATAVDVTMAPAPVTLLATWPIAIFTPRLARRRVTADSFRSEPLIV
ncbi:hypothetical protein G6F57_022730 [Rhizopus arrhizus]|nr:hypothetical protein G6F57_022730 [Rhizopus arrhizus]